MTNYDSPSAAYRPSHGGYPEPAKPKGRFTTTYRYAADRHDWTVLSPEGTSVDRFKTFPEARDEAARRNNAITNKEQSA